MAAQSVGAAILRVMPGRCEWRSQSWQRCQNAREEAIKS